MFLTFNVYFFMCKTKELGREPTLDEQFLRTHTNKKNSSWLDDRTRKQM